MDFASFRRIADNTGINQTSSRVFAGEENGLSVGGRASLGDKLGRAFHVKSCMKGSYNTNVNVRHELAVSLAKELGIYNDYKRNYGGMLEALQKEFGKNVFDAKMFKDDGLWSGRPLTARRVTCIVNAVNEKNGGVAKLSSGGELLTKICADEVEGLEDSDDGMELEDLKNSDGMIELKEMAGSGEAVGAKGPESSERSEKPSLLGWSLASKAVHVQLRNLEKPDLMKGSNFAGAVHTERVVADDEKEVQRMKDHGYEVEDKTMYTGVSTTTKKSFFGKIKTTTSLNPVELNVMSRVGRAWTNEANIMTVGSHRCTREGALDLIKCLRTAIEKASAEEIAHNSGPSTRETVSALDKFKKSIGLIEKELKGVTALKDFQQTREDLALLIEFYNNHN